VKGESSKVKGAGSWGWNPKSLDRWAAKLEAGSWKERGLRNFQLLKELEASG